MFSIRFSLMFVSFFAFSLLQIVTSTEQDHERIRKSPLVDYSDAIQPFIRFRRAGDELDEGNLQHFLRFRKAAASPDFIDHFIRFRRSGGDEHLQPFLRFRRQLDDLHPFLRFRRSADVDKKQEMVGKMEKVEKSRKIAC